MILEERNYTTVPGGAPKYLALWQEHGRSAQERILGPVHGVWTVEVGSLNTIVFHWIFTDPLDRQQRRAELMADPEFAQFRGRVRDLLVSQTNRILITAGLPSSDPSPTTP